ncbi:MAG: hypothetical protein FWH14_08250 [Oscillospiraceae bacterium]|nr:hypothetical protein [Oscillospiraceae bacterium]
MVIQLSYEPSPSRPGVTPLPKGEARTLTGFAITTVRTGVRTLPPSPSC